MALDLCQNFISAPYREKFMEFDHVLYWEELAFGGIITSLFSQICNKSYDP